MASPTQGSLPEEAALQPATKSAFSQSHTNSTLWWPQAAAGAFNARAFGGKSLPKASKLPKAGTAGHLGPERLYDSSTLTSALAAVRIAWLANAHGTVLDTAESLQSGLQRVL